MKPTFQSRLAVLSVLGLLLTAGAEAQKVSKKGMKRGTATATLVNRTSFAIHHVFLSHVDDSYWGADQLGDTILPSGESLKVTDIPCGRFDVMLVDEDGDECVVEDVQICGDVDEWILTDAELLSCQGFVPEESVIPGTVRATFVNQSGYTLHNLYFSPSSTPDWGEDHLETGVLENGYAIAISGTALPCGLYDIKVVDEDGDECVVEDVDMCGKVKWILTRRDLLSCQGWL